MMFVPLGGAFYCLGRGKKLLSKGTPSKYVATQEGAPWTP